MARGRPDLRVHVKKTGSARDVRGDAPVEFRADLCSRPLAAGWRGPSGFDLDRIAVVASSNTCLSLRELLRHRNAVVRSHARAERSLSRAVAPFPRAPAVRGAAGLHLRREFLVVSVVNLKSR